MSNLKDRIKLSNIYYSPQGYWKGLSAVQKLSKASGITKDKVKNNTWTTYYTIFQHLISLFTW